MPQFVLGLSLFLLHLPSLVNGAACRTWHNGAFTDKVNLVSSARCEMVATSNNPNPEMGGQFEFLQDPTNDYSDQDEGITKIQVSYAFNLLTNGDHRYHVHRYGDIFAADGAATGSHFVGVTNSRPQGGNQEVGLLNDGIPVQSDGGESSGSFPDNVATMNHYNSILGRGMVIHGTEDPDPNIRAGQCVVGLTGENSGIQMYDSECVSKATCTLTPIGDATVSGTVEIMTVGDGETKKLVFKALVYGLNNGAYSITAHTKGDVSADAANIGSLFGGSHVDRTAGLLGGEDFSFQSKDGWATASFEDTVVGLNGPNSILGRSLVVRSLLGKFAVCAVGLAKNAESPEPMKPTGVTDGIPQITAASAVFQSATPALYGYVEFFLLESDHWLGGEKKSGSRIRYRISGLTPGMEYRMSITQYGGALNDFVGWNVTYPFITERVAVGGFNHSIQADANGHAHAEIIDPHIKFNDYNSVLGRSIVIYSYSEGENIMSGIIGRMEERTTLDHPRSPVTQAEVNFIAVNQGSATGSSLSITSAGRVDYDIKNLQVNHTYILHVHKTGDLFSINDAARQSFLSAGTLEEALLPNLQLIPMGPSGNRVGSFTSGAVKLNGGDSNVLGRVVSIVDSVTLMTVAAGVVAIKEDNPSYTGPTDTELHCDINCIPATDPPTLPPGPGPAKNPTTPPSSATVSVFPLWGTWSVVFYTLLTIFLG